MTGDGWITIAVIVGMVIVMAANLAGPGPGVDRRRHHPLLHVGIIEPSEAFTGFSNPAVITIAALFVVAAGVKETGGLDLAGRVVLGSATRSLAGGQLPHDVSRSLRFVGIPEQHARRRDVRPAHHELGAALSVSASR